MPGVPWRFGHRHATPPDRFVGVKGGGMGGPLVLVAAAAAGWVLVGYLACVSGYLGRRAYRQLEWACAAAATGPRRAGAPLSVPAFPGEVRVLERRRAYVAGMVRSWVLVGVCLAVVAGRGLAWVRLGIAPVDVPGSPGRIALVLGAGLAAAAATLLRRRATGRAPGRWAHPVAALLPTCPAERRFFAAAAVTAGMTEEVLYRGFLPLWLGPGMAHLGIVPVLLVASAAFGLAHLYQGATCATATGLWGLGLALSYLATGSLLLPVAIHVAVDLRLLRGRGPQPR